MELEEAKEQFVQTWGTLGSNWGINRTMAQIHALLLISPEPLNAKDIKERLKISSGNVNMNIRDLISWGLVQKELKPGERQEYFTAEKDIWEVSKCIMRERKKRELDPVKKALDQLSEVEGNQKDKDYEQFITIVQDIQKLTDQLDKVLNKVSMVERNWFLKTFMKLFR